MPAFLIDFTSTASIAGVTLPVPPPPPPPTTLGRDVLDMVGPVRAPNAFVLFER